MISAIHRVGKGAFGRLPAVLGLGLALSLLAGCGGGSSIQSQIPDLICPSVGLVQNTSVLTKFREGGEYLEEDVLYEAHISQLGSDCDEESGGVVADFAFNVTATKGPASGTDQVSLPYFVAVTTQGGAIISKQVFNAVVNFSEEGRGTVRERLNQHIQAEGQDFHEYEILIGFQLTEDDLVYNLAH